MININLLPEEYRKEKLNISKIVQQYKSLAIPIIGLVIGVIVIVSLLVVVYPKWQALTLRRLESRWKNIEKDYGKITKLKKEEKELKDRLDNIEYIAKNRLLLSAKLNQISDALPSEIQLTEISMITEEYKDKSSKEVFVVSGLLPAVPGERAIEDFIKNLKADPSFTEDFPQIELPLTESTKGGFKKFILKCFLAEKYILEETSPRSEGKLETGKEKKLKRK